MFSAPQSPSSPPNSASAYICEVKKCDSEMNFHMMLTIKLTFCFTNGTKLKQCSVPFMPCKEIRVHLNYKMSFFRMCNKKLLIPSGKGFVLQVLFLKRYLNPSAGGEKRMIEVQKTQTQCKWFLRTIILLSFSLVVRFHLFQDRLRAVRVLLDSKSLHDLYCMCDMLVCLHSFSIICLVFLNLF